MNAMQHKAFGLPRPAGRSQLAVVADGSPSGGLTSNSSLLGPSLNLGGSTPSLGPKLATGAPAPVSIDSVTLASGVSTVRSTSSPASLCPLFQLLNSITDILSISRCYFPCICIRLAWTIACFVIF